MAVAASLPSDLPAPIVVGQHLDPTHESHLAAILTQRGTLPVRIVTSEENLEPGTLYVIPPNRDVEIVDGKATVHEPKRTGPKPSIDELFASAAASYGDRVIAVILSGMGTDGLAGARAVKEQGGTVLIQDPTTATHPSMPLAIPPNLADVVVRPEKVGETLTGILRGSMPPEAPSEVKMLRQLLTQLRDRTGIDFLQYKTPTIMRRLARLMVASGAASLGDYLRYLQSHPEGYNRLVSAFLIKVTEFFRDAALFQDLRDTVLPRLIAQAAEGSREVRIWSAGSSTGEEAYSLAILCAELLREDPDQVNVRIFATDIDGDAIAFARRGIYTREALKHLPEVWLDRYFVRIGDSFEVSKRIRNMTVFGQHDLGQRAPFPRIDLCTCRNVLIYFTRELQMRALQLFAFSLREGGFLVLGKAESTNPLPAYFSLVNQSLRIYQRNAEPILIPPLRIKEPSATVVDLGGHRMTSTLPIAVSDRLEARHAAAGLLGSVVSNSAVGIVVVDRRYDIAAINPAARALLEIHGIGVGDDVIHSTNAFDSRTMRGMIDAAFRNEPTEPAEVTVTDAEGRTRHLSIACQPENPGEDGKNRYVGLIVLDITTFVAQRGRLEREAADQRSA
ncbi:MAG: hypothetical protein JO359_00060, partial [Candidatus Eremiobacteraeota bacterium]|nr:hypothetical protein [Candidatus Eremiobacteraeota bacterium]